MQKTLSRAGNSIREGLGEYFGITDKYENTPRSYYVENQDAPNSPSNEPYWMKEKFWEQEEGGIDLQAASAPPMDGVTVVIPNSGYDEPPPAYHDLPQGYTGGQQAYIPQFVPANVGAVPTADAAGMGMSMEMSDGSPYMNGRGRGGRGRGRGRGRGAGGRGRGRGGASGGGPRSKGKAAVVQPPQYKPYFIMTCTIIDVVLIVWEIILNGGFEPWSVNPWFGPSTNVLLDCGAKYSPKILAGEWWRFVSPMFLHVGLGHLLMNMLMQVRVGVSLEKSYGAHRIVPIYLICGIMGNLISAIMLPDQVQVGASGALYGFMGVLFADLFQNWGLIQSPMKNLGSLIITTLISLGTGLVLPGVDNFAHLGGGIMGVLTGFVFLPTLNPAKKGKKGRILTVAICLPLMVFMFVALFIVFYRQISASEWCHGCQYITCIKALSWCRAANT